MIYSRRQTLKLSVISIDTTINSLLPLIEGSIGGEAAINVDIADGIWNCYLDEGLLENTLLNLAINARDAMPSGGTLGFAARNVHLTRTDAQRKEVVPGAFVEVIVSDDGIVMDTDTAAKAFEPFFTTKPIGKGTGLRLSMVFGFVKQSGGHIELNSAPGRGTTITILLPRTLESTTIERITETDRELLQGKQVLLIEDNDELRDVIQQLLESFGCLVTVSNGESISPQQTAIDIILSDVILPGRVRGPDLVAEIKRQFPELPLYYLCQVSPERGLPATA